MSINDDNEMLSGTLDRESKFYLSKNFNNSKGSKAYVKDDGLEDKSERVLSFRDDEEDEYDQHLSIY